jgi:hypothetical protein
VNLLLLYLEDKPHATRGRMWLKHEGVSPNIGRDTKTFLNKNFEERWIGRNVSVAWPSRSPDLNPADFLL